MEYDDLKKVTREGSVFLLLCYIAGFMAWNSYLSHFGFFESNLLQTRFLSAGLLILSLPLAIFFFSEKIRNAFNSYKISRQIFLFIIWVLFFGQCFSPIYPNIGEGQSPML